jgi:rod shape-determining protein MreC
MIVKVGDRGAHRDQVVLAERGVVGRVVEVVGPWARVQLLTDRAAAAGVVLERAGKQGIVRGADARLLELEHVPLQTEIEVGEGVWTAGIDGVYPRGLPVGTVSSVEPGDERFLRVRVRPEVDVGELSLVYLLERTGPPRDEPWGRR